MLFLCCCCFWFFIEPIHAKNPIISSVTRNFFSSVSNSISFVLWSISFMEKFNTSQVFFVTKLYAKCFASLFSPCGWNSTFTHREDFFISPQFSMWLRYIIPIAWCSLPFMNEYLASTNPPTVTNIFSVWFFAPFEKSSPSRVNLTVLFYISQTYFEFYHFLFWFLWGLLSLLLQYFVDL